MNFETAINRLNVELFSIGQESITGGRLISGIAFFVVIWFLSVYSDRWFKRVAPTRSTTLTRIKGFSKVIRISIVSVGFLFFLEIIGISVQSVFALIAALGIGIGFGLQNLVNNFISGFIILLESPIRVGDIVEVSGKFGRVVEIGVRATRMVDWDNVEILVPNSKVLDENLVNWTLSDGLSRIGIDFGVHYSSDRELVRRTALAIANGHGLTAESPEPVLILSDFGESSIDYRLNVWSRSPWQRNQIAGDIRESLMNAFQENGITIPYPQRDVHMHGSTSNDA